jgi:hypothetical protein
MGLFTRRSDLGRRLDDDRRTLSELAPNFEGAAEDGGFDMAAFAIRAFELAPTDDIDMLITQGCDGSEFYVRELRPNWEDLTREQRAAKIASFVRFANLLNRSDPEPGTNASEQLTELRASVLTKIVLLASAYDCEYGDTYCRRIARNPQRFGDYELTHA